MWSLAPAWSRIDLSHVRQVGFRLMPMRFSNLETTPIRDYHPLAGFTARVIG